MTEDTHAFDGIELADAIESVRDQLTEAAGRAAGQPLVFELGDIHMEFTLELRKELKGGAKVRAWVVDAGADAGRSTGRTHKVSFTLKPHAADGGSAWKVGNDGPGGRFGAGPR
ncbi:MULTISPECIES: trypco2 family protein [unclassified Streptomyces]|uniref:trypco2 family protein n=1 Tax=unclassified Streptomyces TaxID=2593676 RepID=UPI0038250386